MSGAAPAQGNWVIDPVALAAELIRRPSITPRDEGALDIVAARLERLGFVCHRLVFGDPGPNGEETAPIANLYARLGTGRPNLDRKSTRLNSSHIQKSRMPSSA